MFIGRTREIQVLTTMAKSAQAEFMAIYGRRRVGKTSLIRHVFAKSHMFLEFVGQKNAPLKQQLDNYHKIFSAQFFPGLSLRPFQSWNEALQLLTDQLRLLAGPKPIILFFDELPWLCSRKSGFLEALDYFWNQHWSQMKRIKLVVCGSAAGWMMKNIVSATGGLHHRLTHKLCLEPFSLQETKDYLKSRKLPFTNMGILELYMAIGGVPYYLSLISKGASVAEILDQMFFQTHGFLRHEFQELFLSLYENAEIHMRLVQEIASAHYGLTREQIIARTKMPSGGRLDQRLFELEAGGFIQIVPLLDKKREKRYRIKDPFVVFYLQWVKDFVQKQQAFVSYWGGVQGTGGYEAWAGFAFEHVCFAHMDQILQSYNQMLCMAMGLSSASCLLNGFSILYI